MKEFYLQNYFFENYILILIVIGICFVVAMKSAVEIFVKKQMIISMTTLVLLSITNFYMIYFKENLIEGFALIITEMLYYTLKPVIMIFIIKMIEKKNKLIYIPSILNLIFYCGILVQENILHLKLENRSQFIEYSSIITEWLYWIILLYITNFKFYRKKYFNYLGIFFAIAVLMGTSILSSTKSQSQIFILIYALAFLFYYLVIHVYISQQVNEEKEVKLREQRLLLMLSQIQPHFLYNTLNTITALCRSNPKLAEETTVKFSKYLRENMYSMGENDIHSFSQELEHTNIYLEIEKLRFGNRLNVEYDIKSDDFNMPILTLQPIVENAVKHGICKKVEGGTIKISTEKKGNDNIITIIDNGVGFEIEKVLNDGNPHIGIQNVRERLKIMLKAEMEIKSFVGIGTTIKIIIPGKKQNIKFESGERREILSIGR
ncbi:MAG: histidine kinase [Fusobacterium gastrosuis]|uniref:sensor histidine kinase n=1 Tax=Fusobacterium gastrosuis TaxID=1755100 RepID=UPI002A8D5B4C|nr:histidine kinase [Fusobacterium gastrosuis]